jgi:hypothetical protein
VRISLLSVELALLYRAAPAAPVAVVFSA